MSYCGKCGAQAATNEQFCRSCGGPLSVEMKAESKTASEVSPETRQSVSVTRVLVAVALCLAVGGAAGYWWLNRLPSCDDGSELVLQLLRDEALRPFTQPQRTAISKAVSIKLEDVIEGATEGNKRECNAVLTVASLDQEFSKLVEYDGDGIELRLLQVMGLMTPETTLAFAELKMLRGWDPVLKSVRQSFEYSVSRSEGGSAVQVPAGLVLASVSPLLSVAAAWSEMAPKLKPSQKAGNSIEQTDSQPSTQQQQPGDAFQVTADGEQVQTSLGNLKVVCPREEELGCAEPIRVMWRDQELYRSDVAQSFEFLQDSYPLQDGHAVILAEYSGGTACPAMYAVILIERTGGATITGTFGSCSDLPRIKAETNALDFTFPTANGSETYRFADRRITETRQ